MSVVTNMKVAQTSSVSSTLAHKFLVKVFFFSFPVAKWNSFSTSSEFSSQDPGQLLHRHRLLLCRRQRCEPSAPFCRLSHRSTSFWPSWQSWACAFLVTTIPTIQQHTIIRKVKGTFYFITALLVFHATFSFFAARSQV